MTARPVLVGARRGGDGGTVAQLFERDGELARLAALFEACVAGCGGVAVVSGPVGIGKTALLRAVAERVAALGGVVLCATGVRAERSVPLGVVSELFLSLEPPAPAADRVRRQVDEITGQARSAGIDPVHSRVLRGLWAALRDLAADAPVLLSVDDVHHADPESLQWLLYAVRRLSSSRVLVLLAESEHAHRTNPLFRTELLRERCERIRLGRLSAGGVARLAGQRLDAAAAAELASFSAGNPLLVRALLADQRPASPDPSSRTSSGLLVGDAFAQAVMSCVHRVGPTMLAAVRGLALLGEATSSAFLAKLLDVDAAAAARAIRGLQDAGLLAVGWFRHPAAARAVLDSLSERDRRDGHRRIAALRHDEGAPAPAVARHLVAAGHTGDEWVLPVLQEAAELARRGDEVSFAVECLELATQACDDDAQRAAVTMQLSRIQRRVNPAAAARHLAPLTTALLAGHLPAGDAPCLVRALLWHGRVGAATEVLAHTGVIEDGSCPDAAAQLLITGEWLRSLRPGPAQPPAVTAVTPVAAVLPVAAVTPVTPVAATGLHAPAAVGPLTDTLTRGAGEGTVAAAEQLLRAAHLDDDSLDSIESALLVLVYADRTDSAASWCATMVEQASARGASMWRARLAALQAEIALRRGGAPAAERLALAALDHMSPRSWGVAIGAPLATLVLALLAMGRTGEAAQRLDQPVPAAMARTRYGVLYQHARGRHQLAAQRPHPALADFLACGEQLGGWGIDLPALVPWRTAAAAAQLRLGDREAARRLAEEQLSRSGARPSRAYAMSLRVLAATGEIAQRPRLLRQAAEALQATGDRLELARTLADLSRAYGALGDQARSQALVQQALRLAEECRAEPLVRALLGQPGGARCAASAVPASRTGNVEGSGSHNGNGNAAVLSDAERRVASLVARGSTNREVAQALFITVSTVEQHLTRIYRKLNVSGRSDLSGRLGLDIIEPPGRK